MNATQAAGDREAAGAVAAMRQTYGAVELPEIGLWVQGTSHGKRFSGEVVQADPRSITVQLDGAVITVPPSCLDDWF